MAYTYSNGDGAAVLLTTEPNGATEPLSNLDNAIRQIKAYINDPIAGPDPTLNKKIGATKVIVTQTSAQTIAAGAGITPIEFDNIDLDPSGEFDDTTFKFTATDDGLYLVTVGLTLDVTASAAPTDILYQMDIFIDGASGARTKKFMDGSVLDTDLQLTRLFDLSAGQTVWIKFTLTVGSGTMTVTVLNDPRETILQIVKQPVL
jgi:hypothetical protein